MPESKQRGRCITAPPAQARACRYPLVEGYGSALLFPNGIGQQPGSFPDQVVLLADPGQIFAKNFNLRRRLEFDVVTQIDGLEYGLNIVITIRTPAEDRERQIYLRE